MKDLENNNEESGIWAEGSYSETMSSWEREAKMRTFHMKHDEEMNYGCGRCKGKMSAHNRDWHAGMCDDCFNKAYFPGTMRDKEQQMKL